MKLWIARDKDGTLWMYNAKPNKYTSNFDLPEGSYELNYNLFPEVTFENSPREVELKLL